MKKPGEKEQQVLDYIVETIRNNGYSPSVRDIQNALGLGSTSTVHMYLAKLEAAGFLQKENGKSRTLRVADSLLFPSGIPLLVSVHPDLPLLAAENTEGSISFDVPSARLRRENLFAVHIVGDDMRERGILDGDYVVAESGDSAENGDVVIVLAGEKIAVKTFYREHDDSCFWPEHPGRKGENIRILGRVIACLRYYDR